MAVDRIASSTKALPLCLLLAGLSPLIALANARAETRDRELALALESPAIQTDSLLLEEKTTPSAVPPPWQSSSQTELAIAPAETEELASVQEQPALPHRLPATLTEIALPPQTLVEAGLEPTVLAASPPLPPASTPKRTSVAETHANSSSAKPDRHPEALPSDNLENPSAGETLAEVSSTSAESLRVPFILETEFRGRAGRQSGGLNLRIPLWQDSDSLLFSDLHFSGAGDGTLLGNFGLGYRHILSTASDRSDAWIVGAYGFYDRKRSEYGFTYNQATVGTELYNNRFEFRANGYLNGGDSHVIGRRQLSDVVLQPSSTGMGLDFVRRTFTLEARDRALPGFDVEIGYRHPFSEDLSLGLHGGYFHFDSNDTPTLSGPMGRLQLEWEDAFGLPGGLLTSGAHLRHDDIRGTQVTGFLRFSIPLGRNRPKKNDPFDGVTRLARRPIERNYEITTFAQDITRDVSIEELAAAAANSGNSNTLSQSGPQFVSTTTLATCVPPLTTPNNACRLFFVDGDGTAGNGLQTDPLTVAQATNAGITNPGDILFLLDDAGQIDTAPGTGGSFTLQDNQQLLGVGNATSRIVMNVPGINADLTVTDSGRPMLFNSGAGDVITLANNNTLDGFGIAGMMMGRDGIAGNGGTGGTINDVIIEQTGRDGIHLENWNGITISNTTVTDATRHGVFLSSPSGALNFTGTNTINHGKAVATGDAFQVEGGNATINYSGNIANTTNNAVNRLLAIRNTTGGSVTFSGGTLSQTTGDGILIENAAGSTTLNNNSNITGGAGIDIQGGAGNVTVNGNTTIANNTGTAINVENRTGGTVQFGTVNLSNSGGIGINLTNNAGAFRVTGPTTIDGATDVSVDINGGTGGVNFAGVTINNRGNVGIDVNAGNQAINFGAVSINNQNSSTATALNIQNTAGGSVIATSTTIDNNNANAEGVTLLNNAATVNLGGGSITGAANTAFRITQEAANVSYAGSITNTAGRSVEVTNSGGTPANTINFTGAINDTGRGIFLNNNDLNAGATVNFSGGLTLATGANAAFTATNGGTVNVTGTNTVTTTTGTGVNIANTTIGFSNVTFRSVSVTGAANGIIVNNAGSTGSFIVTGITAKPDGGTISTTAEGVQIIDSNASLSHMDISSSMNNGVEISHSSAGTSTVTLTDNNIGSTSVAVPNDGLNVRTTAGTLDLVVNSNMFSSSTGDGTDIDGSGGGALNITGFSDNMVTSAGGNGLSITSTTFDASTAMAGIQQVNAGTTQVGTVGAIGGAGINFTNTAGTVTFEAGSSIENTTGTAFNADSSAANITYNGTITQNNAASAVNLTNNNGGTIDFNGLVTANTSTATGINLINNTGTTVNFGGGLNIDTTTGTGFNAAGGGTINVTATSGDESINATNGEAVNLTNVNANAAFDSISSANATDDGFDLDGVSGSFSVSGTTTINNSGDNSITIGNSAANVSFNTVNVNNAGRNGIQLQNNSGTFEVTNAASSINGVGALGAGFAVGDGAANVTYNGDITVGAGDGLAVLVAGRTGGAVTFNNGTITSIGATGIRLPNPLNFFDPPTVGVYIGPVNGLSGALFGANSGGSTVFDSNLVVNTGDDAFEFDPAVNSGHTVTGSGTLTVNGVLTPFP